MKEHRRRTDGRRMYSGLKTSILCGDIQGDRIRSALRLKISLWLLVETLTMQDYSTLFLRTSISLV